MNLRQFCGIIIGVTLIWFGLICRWIDRNPEWGEKARRHEVPYPWFFNVWMYLFFASCGSIVYLIGYYIWYVWRLMT